MEETTKYIITSYYAKEERNDMCAVATAVGTLGTSK